jgi:6-phosphogluconolactonase (cycloisomerase 2 family)
MQYSSGTVATFPISSKSPYLSAAVPKTTQLNGSGPNTLRQETSHVHQVSLLEEYHELLVPDLGADKVHRFKKDDDGLWKLHGHAQCPAGSGPRHVAFYGK